MIIRDQSQGNRILELLTVRGPQWTTALELSEISLQYCRAIAGLRRNGIEIENKVEQRGRIRHGFYRLKQPAAIAHVQPYPKPLAEHADLFPDFERPHRDDN